MAKKTNTTQNTDVKSFYISPILGKDDSNGSADSPFKTLDKALEMARQYINISGAPCNVYLAGGRYFIKKKIELNERYRGLSILAREGETPIFDGGAVVSPSLVKEIPENIKERIIDPKAKDKIMEISFGAHELEGIYGTRGFCRPCVNSQNELFIDGEPFNITAYPRFEDKAINLTEKNIIESGSIPRNSDFECKNAKIAFEHERIKLWKNANSAYVFGYFGSSYADDTIRITLDTKERTFTTALPHLYGFTPGEGHSYRIINLLEEISRPGEYFTDTENGKIYFYPRREITEKSLIQVSLLGDVMFSLKNAINVTISGIIFENSRSTAVYIEGGEGCKITDCIFRNLGVMGIQIGQGAEPMIDGCHNGHGVFKNKESTVVPISEQMGSWYSYLYANAAWNNQGGRNHKISNCSIYDTGCGGMLLSGGDRKTLAPAGNVVENCSFTRNNRINRSYVPSVNLMGVGNKVTHCEFYDLPSTAIHIHGNDHDISYNRIHDVVKDVSDMGAIYIGRDCSEVGNRIHHNFIYDLKSSYELGWGICAVYVDDNAIYNSIYCNYFYNIKSIGRTYFRVLHFNIGGMTSVFNNFFIDCNNNFTPEHPNCGYDAMHDPSKIHCIRVSTRDPMDFRGVDITSKIWKKKYPYLYKTYKKGFNAGTVFYNNIFTGGIEFDYNKFANHRALDFRFSDIGLKEFSQKKSQARITDVIEGIKDEYVPFIIPDFENIGIIKKKNGETENA